MKDGPHEKGPFLFGGCWFSGTVQTPKDREFYLLSVLAPLEDNYLGFPLFD
jgi:hypothetical protein